MPFVTSSFLFLVAMPGATSSVLATSSNALVPSSDALATGSDARHFPKETGIFYTLNHQPIPLMP